MVQAIADAHARDADTKRRVYDAMQRMVAGGARDCDATLRSMLHVWLATWVLSPAVDDDANESEMLLIKAEMHGF